jgi:hypothetical protein
MRVGVVMAYVEVFTEITVVSSIGTELKSFLIVVTLFSGGQINCNCWSSILAVVQTASGFDGFCIVRVRAMKSGSQDAVGNWLKLEFSSLAQSGKG